MFKTWLYISVPELPDDAHAVALDAIVGVSRIRNANLNVTGALIFSGSRFAQLIEGPVDSVAILREAIERDVRHRSVTTIEASAANGRLFEGWSLAYCGHSTFVDRELRRISDQHGQDAAGASRNLKLVLTEFSRSGGINEL
ncbi:BLUF domain-containing protein [Sphingobium sp. 3R8]|uniref:BLUF domain-containing protein n=1 Tax=Sphingobium sp. 3R8 TaxID=2874921 RepID=UPI001CCE02A7|nr:BLUF domain-containing protein [Sphingobium sp. 3R8]MBZ9649241.1 BLUF domain-containing protein [Sphingobium sp. 3R8]